MSIFLVLYQDNRKNSKFKGQWYARAKTVGTKDLNDIAEIVQRNSGSKKSDVLAVLTETAEVVSDLLSDGYRVKLDGLGALKVASMVEKKEKKKKGGTP